MILGKTGRNFAAGMTGGIAYVFDMAGRFKTLCNTELVDLEMIGNDEESAFVKSMLEKHLIFTKSQVARRILDQWLRLHSYFIKVLPRDFKRVLEETQKIQSEKKKKMTLREAPPFNNNRKKEEEQGRELHG